MAQQDAAAAAVAPYSTQPTSPAHRPVVLHGVVEHQPHIRGELLVLQVAARTLLRQLARYSSEVHRVRDDLNRPKHNTTKT